MTKTKMDKPLKHFCVCGRGFTSRSGEANHGRVCPVERARSAAFVSALESGRDPHAAARAALDAYAESEVQDYAQMSNKGVRL